MRAFYDKPWQMLAGIIMGLFPGVLAAQQPGGVRPAVQVRESSGADKMVIYNGPNRSVRYFADSTSPGEIAALRDLERTENELAYVDRLRAFCWEYVNIERGQNVNRSMVQDRLYGLATTENNYAAFNNAGFGGYGYPFYGAARTYSYPWEPSGLSSSSSVSRSLANGVGDEGAIKTSLARTIAAQATPEYVASAVRGYASVLARVGESDRLSAVAGVGPRGEVRRASLEQAPPTVLTLKSGDKVEGAMVSEDADWIAIQTAKEEISVRKSEVTRITKMRGN